MPDKPDAQVTLNSLEAAIRAQEQRIRAQEQRLERLAEDRRKIENLLEELTEFSGFSERGLDLVRNIQEQVGGSTADIIKRALTLYLQAVRAEKANRRIAFLDEDDNIVFELRDVGGHPRTPPATIAG